jgi:hypothetical protein
MTDVGRRLALGARRIVRGARRIVLVLRRAGPVAGIALIAVVAVIATVVVRVAAPPSAAPGRATSPVRVGVSDGDSVPGYLDASRAELAGLVGDEPVYALVSLSGYLAPDELAGLLGSEAGVTAVFALARVPVPNRQTEIVRLAAQRVPDDITRAMTEVAARKERDAAGYRSRAGAEPDPVRSALYRSNAEVSAAEAASYRAGCACVFALVVRAPPAALVALSEVEGVRAVDVATDVGDLGQAVFVAPLPEQTDVVRPLPDDLTSSDGVTPAVRSS